jgi:hypothetical protein
MAKYRIAGANSTDAREVEVTIEAATEHDALETAGRRGIFVSSVHKINDKVRQKSSPLAISPMSFGKSLAKMSAAFICMLALITILFYFIITDSLSERSSPRNIGVVEEAFIAAVKSGDIDLVRDSLLKPVNWRQAATPALKAIVIYNWIGRSTFELDEAKRERQFWIDLSDKLIQNGADVNAALRLSGRYISIENLRFLIDRKADVNSATAFGDTLLHELSKDEDDDRVAFLIENGANVNIVGSELNTPLHLAAKNGAVKVIWRLLGAGAKINAKNSAGQTPLAIAKLTMQREAAMLLKERGGAE